MKTYTFYEISYSTQFGAIKTEIAEWNNLRAKCENLRQQGFKIEGCKTSNYSGEISTPWNV